MEDRRARTKRHEGWKLVPYRCSMGHWTVGAGWNMDANPLPPDIAAYLKVNGRITDAMGERLLDITLATAEAACKRLFPRFDSLDIVRQDALVDVTLNMGEAKIRKLFPSFVKAVNRQDWQRAADELKYSDGLKKDKLSPYWTQLHGDPDGKDDGRLERPEEIYKMLTAGTGSKEG